MRCVSSGRKCDGYQSPGNSEWEILTSVSLNASNKLSSDPKLVGNAKAGSSLEFFRLRTVTQLSSLFGSNFWQEIILRAAQNNDTIWHAVVAVGAAHREVELRGDSFNDEWAVQQYSKAISHLTGAKGRTNAPTVDVTLAVCLLFVAFEVLSDLVLFKRFCAKTLADVH
jgi:transcription factor-like protein